MPNLLRKTPAELLLALALALALPAAAAAQEGGLVVPLGPTNLSVAPAERSVTLSWTAPSGPITSYEYAVDGGTTWTAMPGSGPSTTAYQVTGLKNWQEYQFTVRAVNLAGKGRPSAVVRETPGRPDKPTVTATLTGTGTTTVRLTWTKPAGAVTGYQIRLWQTGTTRTDPRYGTGWQTLPVSTTRQTLIPGLLSGTEWSFQVRANSRAGYGGPSDEVKIIVPTNMTVNITVEDDRVIAGANNRLNHFITIDKRPPNLPSGGLVLTPAVTPHQEMPAEGDEYTVPTQTVALFSGSSVSHTANYYVTTTAADDADNDIDQYKITFSASCPPLNECPADVDIKWGTGTLLEKPSWVLFTGTGKLTMNEGSTLILGARIDGETGRGAVGNVKVNAGTAETGDWTLSSTDSVRCLRGTPGVAPTCDSGSTNIILTANEDTDADDETVVVSLQISRKRSVRH